MNQGAFMMSQTDYFRSHTPRCIAGFTARATNLPGVVYDGHASFPEGEIELPPGVTIQAPEEFNSVFALSCSCGGDHHFVHGFRWVNPDNPAQSFLYSPLVLECATCGKKTEVFNEDKHGYDVELAEFPSRSVTLHEDGEVPEVFECPTCGCQPLEVIVRFAYTDDLFNGDFQDFAGREQDLFDWFSLLGKCPQCSEVLAITDFECA
jgi:hypothetical protein